MALIGEMRYLQIGGNTYEIPTSELPIASSSTLGGIKVGTNLSIDSSTGVLSVTGIPTKISDITTYDNFGIGYIDCNSSDRNIFVSNVEFGTSGSSDYSSPFLLMFQKGSWRSGTVTIPGSGSFHFYDINTNQLLYYQTSVNYTNLQYGKLYIAYMSDNVLTIKSIAETTDIPTIPTNISAFTNDAGYITSSDIPVTSVNGQTGAVTLSIPTISITQNLTSGTKSATININGTDYDIYSEKNTDTKVMQIPLNGVNASHGLLFSLSGSTQTTIGTVYTSNKILYSDYTQCLYIYNSDRTKYGYYKFDSLYLANSTTSYSGLLKTADVTASRTYTLPDATGTIALTSDIHSIPTGGTAGQFLVKSSSTDYDAAWVTVPSANGVSF